MLQVLERGSLLRQVARLFLTAEFSPDDIDDVPSR